jgi:hypothetical protein
MNVASCSESFSYDSNQNMTFDGVNALTYDVENRLTQAVNLAWSLYKRNPSPANQRIMMIAAVNPADRIRVR